MAHAAAIAMSLSQGDQAILDQRVRPLMNAAVVAEHRAAPFGPHSPALVEILHFLRRSPDPALPRYVVLRLENPRRWSISARPRRGGAFRPIDETTYESRADAEHAVFRLRLTDYGLWSSARGDAAQGTSGTPNIGKLPSLMGYLDTMSVAPGGTLELHVSSEASRWRAEIVQLLSADLAPEGPPLREERIAGWPPIERDGIVQHTPAGSYVHIDMPPDSTDPAAGLSLRAYVMPALPGEGRQAFISNRDSAGVEGLTLGLNDSGAVAVWTAGNGATTLLELDVPLVRGCWYLVAAVIDAAGPTLRLGSRPVGTRAANRVWVGRGVEQRRSSVMNTLPRSPTDAAWFLGCAWLDERRQPYEVLDGRLELPMLMAGAVQMDRLLGDDYPDAKSAVADLAPLAAWDFAAGIGSHGLASPSMVRDLGPSQRHGRCVNHPTRAVTSHQWTSAEPDFRHAPSEYAAAHFHRDDMTNCAWTPQAQIDVPPGLKSGVYAIRLESGTGSEAEIDRIPFVVRPPAGRATAVLSTNSYLAYANDHVSVDSPRMQMLVRRALQFTEFDQFRNRRRELGASLYEAHPDGTGICYSSGRRPILTMRPQAETFNGRAWQFTADMQIVDWLDRQGRAFDVVTDLDVHREGETLLRRYACVVSGTHPEYPTLSMLDAYGDYIDHGGRFVYMGGNGLYWVTAYDPEDDQVIEIRRWGGSQAWQARPGEYYLSFTGELGGLWRNRGRAPQKTVGVGFVAAGLVDAGATYASAQDLDPRAAWVLAGVNHEIFGARGTCGPAAGLEIDAIDPELGSPAQTLLIATSSGRHNNDMAEARENYGMTLAAPGGGENPRVRADMTLLPVAGGGGVFSTGSIAWAGSLAHDPHISRIFRNVLDRFSSSLPLLD